MKPKVLVTEPIHRVGWSLLATEAEAVAWAGPQAEPLAQALEGAQGVIVRSARLPGEIIRSAKRLKIIAKHGAGVEKGRRFNCAHLHNGRLEGGTKDMVETVAVFCSETAPSGLLAELGHALADRTTTVYVDGENEALIPFSAACREHPEIGVTGFLAHDGLGLGSLTTLVRAVDFRYPTVDPLPTELRYGIQIGSMLSADGLIIVPGPGPLLFLSLVAALASLRGRSDRRPKRVAILKTGCGDVRWDPSWLADEFWRWGVLDNKTQKQVFLAETAEEAAAWVTETVPAACATS